MPFCALFCSKTVLLSVPYTYPEYFLLLSLCKVPHLLLLSQPAGPHSKDLIQGLVNSRLPIDRWLRVSVT